MNQTGDLTPVLRLDGNHKTSVTDGDDGVLQHLLISRGADHFIQLLADTGGGGTHFPPDVVQGRGSGVGDFFFRDKNRLNAFFQIFVGGQGVEAVVQLSFRLVFPGALAAAVVLSPFGQGADDP